MALFNLRTMLNPFSNNVINHDLYNCIAICKLVNFIIRRITSGRKREMYAENHLYCVLRKNTSNLVLYGSQYILVHAKYERQRRGLKLYEGKADIAVWVIHSYPIAA